MNDDFSLLSRSRGERRLLRSLYQRVSEIKRILDEDFDRMQTDRWNSVTLGTGNRFAYHALDSDASPSNSTELRQAENPVGVSEFILFLRQSLEKQNVAMRERAEEIGALEIFRVMTQPQIVRLKIEFQRRSPARGNPMTSTIFVNLILEALRCSGYDPSGEHRENLVNELFRLFDVMDFDDSGDVDWDEFANYLLFAQRELLRRTPEDALLPSVTRNIDLRRAVPRRVALFSSGDFIGCVETLGDSTVLTLFDPTSFVVLEKQTLPKTVESIAYVETLDLWCLSHYDHSLELCRWTREVTTTWTTVHRRPGVMGALVSTFSATHETLFGGSSDGVLSGITLPALRGDTSLVPQLRVHLFPEAIQCVLPVPTSSVKVAVSALFSGAVIVDCRSGVVLAAMKQVSNTPTGIRCMAYLKNVNAVVTAGSSTDAELWMTIAGKNGDNCIGHLTDSAAPHKFRIIAIWTDFTLLPNVVTTIDVGGHAKRWDLRTFVCISNFRLLPLNKDGTPQFVILASTITRVDHCLLYCSRIRDHVTSLRRVELLSKLDLQQAADRRAQLERRQAGSHYCAALDRVVGCIGRDLSCFDLRTGKLEFLFEDVVDTGSITSIAVDPSGRRVYVGSTSGRLLVVASSMTSVVFEYDRHPAEITLTWCTARLIVTGCRDGNVRTFNVGNEKTPFAFHAVGIRDDEVHPITSFSYHDEQNIFVVGDAGGAVHLFDVRLQQRLVFIVSNTKPAPRRLVTDPISPKSNARASIAEQNFRTDQQIFEYLLPSRGEALTIVSLSPYPAFVVADTTGSLSIFCGRYSHPLGAYCGSWEPYTPRALLPGAGQCIVTAGIFMPSTLELFTADDHGCVVVWDMRETLASRRLLCTTSISRHEPLASETSPRVRHCFVVAPFTPLVSIEFEPRRGIFVLAATDGKIFLVTPAGGALGVLYPEHIYETRSPPNYYVASESGDTFDAKQRAQRTHTRAKLLWSKLRSRILGEHANFAAAVATAVRLVRSRQPRSMSVVDINGVFDEDARDEEDDTITEGFRPKPHPCTPCASPNYQGLPSNTTWMALSRLAPIRRSRPLPRVGLTQARAEVPQVKGSFREKKDEKNFAAQVSLRLEQLRQEEVEAVERRRMFDRRLMALDLKGPPFALRHSVKFPRLFEPNMVAALMMPLAVDQPLSVDPSAPEWIHEVIALTTGPFVISGAFVTEMAGVTKLRASSPQPAVDRGSDKHALASQQFESEVEGTSFAPTSFASNGDSKTTGHVPSDVSERAPSAMASVLHRFQAIPDPDKVPADRSQLLKITSVSPSTQSQRSVGPASQQRLRPLRSLEKLMEESQPNYPLAPSPFMMIGSRPSFRGPTTELNVTVTHVDAPTETSTHVHCQSAGAGPQGKRLTKSPAVYATEQRLKLGAEAAVLPIAIVRRQQGSRPAGDMAAYLLRAPSSRPSTSDNLKRMHLSLASPSDVVLTVNRQVVRDSDVDTFAVAFDTPVAQPRDEKPQLITRPPRIRSAPPVEDDFFETRQTRHVATRAIGRLQRGNVMRTRVVSDKEPSFTVSSSRPDLPS
jgi:WD40 repeat protein